MGIGDWNDGMNSIGDEGRGESVWLGWFLCVVLEKFAPVCLRMGDEVRAAHYRKERERIMAAINEHAWDGEWYRRACTDEGVWIGTNEARECRIDAIAQSWSVISGGAPPERARKAMGSFDRELVDRGLMLARLLTPAFDKTEPTPGYIQGYPPGLRENGAQYTHGVIWSIVAWSALGEGGKAAELFRLLNPVSHAKSPGDVRRYGGEPYVMAADVYDRHLRRQSGLDVVHRRFGLDVPGWAGVDSRAQPRGARADRASAHSGGVAFLCDPLPHRNVPAGHPRAQSASPERLGGGRRHERRAAVRSVRGGADSASG